MTSDTFVLCAPTEFEVSYVINPWMDGNISNIDADLAMKQWSQLFKSLSLVSNVTAMVQASGLPDMVFTANAGLVNGNIFVPSRFKHNERKGEEGHFKREFSSRFGFTVIEVPEHIAFEGAGDALFDRRIENHLWMGYGHRTDLECGEWLAINLGITVAALELIDDRFYHLDTCFCPLVGGNLMYYPEAFSHGSRELISAIVPRELRIEVSENDALSFACNAVNAKDQIFMNACSQELRDELEARGYVVHETPLGEFMKAGGAAKCLTLKLNDG